jgi:hypothetical protein
LRLIASDKSCIAATKRQANVTPICSTATKIDTLAAFDIVITGQTANGIVITVIDVI